MRFNGEPPGPAGRRRPGWRATKALVQSAFSPHFSPTAGPEDAATLHHELREMPSAANLAVRVLSRMFVLAEAWEMAPPGSNPCRHVRYCRETSRERFPTPEEFRRLGAALKRLEAEGSMLPSTKRRSGSPTASRRTFCSNGARRPAPTSLRPHDLPHSQALRVPPVGERLSIIGKPHWRRRTQSTAGSDHAA